MSRSGDCLVISAVSVLDVSTSLCTETVLSETLSREDDYLIISVKDVYTRADGPSRDNGDCLIISVKGAASLLNPLMNLR